MAEKSGQSPLGGKKNTDHDITLPNGSRTKNIQEFNTAWIIEAWRLYGLGQATRPKRDGSFYRLGS